MNSYDIFQLSFFIGKIYEYLNINIFQKKWFAMSHSLDFGKKKLKINNFQRYISDHFQ